MSTDKTFSSGIENCRLCGSFALQSLNQQGMYSVHCFNEFSSETFDCDAPEGPECATSEESIIRWNEMQSAQAGMSAGPRKHSFDSKCLDLARYFYPAATEDRLHDLAQRLQDQVESEDIEQPGQGEGNG